MDESIRTVDELIHAFARAEALDVVAPTLWAVAAGLRDDADPGSQPHCDSE